MNAKLSLLRGLSDVVLSRDGVHAGVVHADLLDGQLVRLVGFVFNDVEVRRGLDFVAVLTPIQPNCTVLILLADSIENQLFWNFKVPMIFEVIKLLSIN